MLSVKGASGSNGVKGLSVMASQNSHQMKGNLEKSGEVVLRDRQHTEEDGQLGGRAVDGESIIIGVLGEAS